jgi:hypothetical protein
VRVRLTLAAATALLVLFTFMLGSALSRGKRFACACFGDIAKPLSGRTLGRTALLALIAFTALVAADGDAGLWVTDGIRAEALEAVIAGALLGITVLASRMADLWRWNASPYPTIRERL